MAPSVLDHEELYEPVMSLDLGDGVTIARRRQGEQRQWVVQLVGGYYLNRTSLEWEIPHPNMTDLVARYYHTSLDDALGAAHDYRVKMDRMARARSEAISRGFTGGV
jgi:hypothetical protein